MSSKRLYKTKAGNHIITPFIFVANKIDDRDLRKITISWSAINICRISKMCLTLEFPKKNSDLVILRQCFPSVRAVEEE